VLAGADVAQGEHLVEVAAVQQTFQVPTSRARGWLEERLGPASRRLQVVAELDDPSAVKHALLDGSGVSVLPDCAVERDVRRGELLRLRLDGHDLTRPLLAVWDERVGLSRVQAELLAQL
jgi:DNA-binding transcriptional LysR family regulator